MRDLRLAEVLFQARERPCMPAQRRRWHTTALVVVAALAGPFRSSASILAVALRHVPLCSGLGRYASGLEWLETEHRAAIENQKAMQKVPSRSSAAQMSRSGEGCTARVGRCLIAAPPRAGAAAQRLDAGGHMRRR